jgi:hypothetical protein
MTLLAWIRRTIAELFLPPVYVHEEYSLLRDTMVTLENDGSFTHVGGVQLDVSFQNMKLCLTSLTSQAEAVIVLSDGDRDSLEMFRRQLIHTIDVHLEKADHLMDALVNSGRMDAARVLGPVATQLSAMRHSRQLSGLTAATGGPRIVA